MSHFNYKTKLVIFGSFLAASAQASVLNPGPYIFGNVGTERGEIIHSMPGSRPAHLMQCDNGRCERKVIGYTYRRNDALDAAVKAHLPKLNGAVPADGITDAARSATVGITADLSSTAVGLAAGATELNPILGAAPNPVALLALGLLRQSMVDATLKNPKLSPEQKASSLCTHAGFSTGAAANNIALLATGGGALPLVIGLVVGRAQHSSCMAKVAEAQAWIERRENIGLRAYAASLSATTTAVSDLAPAPKTAASIDL